MLTENWDRVKEVFLAAADLSGGERDHFLRVACADDTDLRESVDRLLAADAKGSDSIVRVIEGEAQSLLDQDALVGTRIGPYRVTGELGRGGMGTVYLAVRDDDQYRKQVAIKLVNRGMDTREVVERFRHERQILANLDHPNVARLLDGGTTSDGKPFLVMEYIEGQPLDVYCSSERLSISQRCRLFLEICDAVTYAHRNLIVHRDLKPGNILVTPEGSPKLLDFGVAKLLDDEGGPGDTMTVQAMRRFTPEYASPEQVQGDPITTASDVYALGVVLYELLSGKRAHQLANHSLREVERVVCRVDPVKPSDAAPEGRRQLQGDLDAIVSMAMRKEPARRYLSVEQLAADVRAYLRGLPVNARHGDFTYRARKYLVRNRTAIGAGALIAATLIGGTTASLIQAKRAARAQALAELERQAAEANRATAERNQTEAQKQAREAERERALADRRFEEVRQLASKFLLDFHDSIAGLPGSTPARKKVVETGLRYYDSLVREARGNRDLLAEIARGYDRLGDAQGNPYMPNLGDMPGALASYRKALALREQVSDSSPEFLRERIAGEVRIAQQLTAMGKLEEATQTLMKTIRQAESGPAAATYPVRLALTSAYSAYGDLKVRVGLSNEALQAYSKLLALWTGLAREGRDPFAERAGISLAHTKIGDVCVTLERGPEALEHLRTALEIDQKLAEETPNSIPRLRKVYVDNLLLSRLFQSGAGEALASPAEQRRVAEAAAAIADQMVAVDPNNKTALTDVAEAQSTLGDLLRNQNDIQGSLAPYRKALEAAEKQAAGTRGILATDELLIMMHHRLGRALGEAGHADEALGQFRLAENYVVESGKQHPGSNLVEYRADIQRGRGDVYLRQSKWPEAITAYGNAIAIFEELWKEDPKNIRYLSAQPNVYAHLATCLAATQSLEMAREAMRATLDRLQKLAAIRPLSSEEEQQRQEAGAKLAEWQKGQ